MLRWVLYVFISLGLGFGQSILGQSAELSFPNRQKVALIGTSMRGWIEPGDSLDLKLDKSGEMPLNYGDFAIIAKGGNPKIPLLKMVVGLPGDSIGFCATDSTCLTVNGAPVLGPHGKPIPLSAKRKHMVFLIVQRIKGRLPEGFYWVTGSVAGTHDSTLFGPVLRKQILGTACLSSRQ